MEKLFDIAKVLRSKNSGPFELTMDILFDSFEKYLRVKNSNKITTELICELYNITESDVRHIVFFEPAMGIKITILRGVSSGTVGERDVYGAQQHAPLMNILID